MKEGAPQPSDDKNSGGIFNKIGKQFRTKAAIATVAGIASMQAAPTKAVEVNTQPEHHEVVSKEQYKAALEKLRSGLIALKQESEEKKLENKIDSLIQMINDNTAAIDIANKQSVEVSENMADFADKVQGFQKSHEQK